MKATMAGMEWDVCEAMIGARCPASAVATATISVDRCRVSLSRKAVELAGDPEALISLYSATERTVGFRVSDTQDALATRLTGRKRDDIGGREFSAAKLSHMMRADGYRGSLTVPVQWHPDGLLWGDLTMATRRKSRAKGGAA